MTLNFSYNAVVPSGTKGYKPDQFLKTKIVHLYLKFVL